MSYEIYVTWTQFGLLSYIITLLCMDRKYHFRKWKIQPFHNNNIKLYISKSAHLSDFAQLNIPRLTLIIGGKSRLRPISLEI